MLISNAVPRIYSKKLASQAGCQPNISQAEAIIRQGFPVLSAAAHKTVNLHMALPKALSLDVRREAARVGLTPSSFVTACMAALMAAPDLLALVQLRGQTSERQGHGRGADGMTMLERGILYLAATHADKAGVAHLVPKAVLSLLGAGASHTGTIAALRRHESRGLLTLMLAQGHRRSKGGVIKGGNIIGMALTREGWAYAQHFAGFEAIGGAA